jgi:hypothetical protein
LEGEHDECKHSYSIGKRGAQARKGLGGAKRNVTARAVPHTAA